MKTNPLIKIPENWNLTENQLWNIFKVEQNQAKILKNEPSKEIRKKLYSNVYETYFEKLPYHPQFKIKNDPIAKNTRLEFQLNQIKPFLSEKTDFTEIGAGDCSLTIEASKYCNSTCALEVSDEIVKDISFPKNSQCLIFDGFNFPFKNESIDLAYSNQLMEHLHPEDAIDQVQEIYRILRKGGKYICITPNGINGPHDISRFYGNNLVGFHLKEYLPSELKKLFIGAGFKRVRAYMMVKKRPIYISIRIMRLVEIVLYLFPPKTRKKLCNFSILKRINNAIIMAIK